MKKLLERVTIRPMSPGDLAEVLVVEKEAYTPGWSEKNFLNEMRNACSYAFVADQGRRILGYLVFWLIRDEVHLLNLTVRADRKRRGVGKKLMAFLIHFSRRHAAKWIDLEVRRSNQAAISMYRTFGFRERRVRRAYYHDKREDGLVMELRLERESE